MFFKNAGEDYAGVAHGLETAECLCSMWQEAGVYGWGMWWQEWRGEHGGGECWLMTVDRRSTGLDCGTGALSGSSTAVKQQRETLERLTTKQTNTH